MLRLKSRKRRKGHFFTEKIVPINNKTIEEFEGRDRGSSLPPDVS